MGRLDGKVALISGGARGQGATEVHMFVREGAKVVFGDVLDQEGRQVEAAVRATGGEARYVHLNVTSESDWRRAVDTAVQQYGKLNVLVNNAGILFRAKIEDDHGGRLGPHHGGQRQGRLPRHEVRASRPCARPAAAPSSTSPRRRAWSAAPARRPRTPRPRAPCASSPRPRRSSTPRTTSAATPSIPGPIATDMIKDVLEDQRAAARQRLRRLPMGRVGTPEDVALRRALPGVRRVGVRDGQRAGH